MYNIYKTEQNPKHIDITACTLNFMRVFYVTRAITILVIHSYLPCPKLRISPCHIILITVVTEAYHHNVMSNAATSIWKVWAAEIRSLSFKTSEALRVSSETIHPFLSLMETERSRQIRNIPFIWETNDRLWEYIATLSCWDIYCCMYSPSAYRYHAIKNQRVRLAAHHSLLV